MQFPKPSPGTYPEYYDTYYQQVTSGNPLAMLKSQWEDGLNPFSVLADDYGNLQYAPGKWTISEVLGHINDTERILSYRLLRLARFDATPVPGFEEDDYAKQGRFQARSLTDLYQEWRAIRSATLCLAESLNEEQLNFIGSASGKPVSALALLWILPAHAAHHAAVVRDRYLTQS